MWMFNRFGGKTFEYRARVQKHGLFHHRADEIEDLLKKQREHKVLNPLEKEMLKKYSESQRLKNKAKKRK